MKNWYYPAVGIFRNRWTDDGNGKQMDRLANSQVLGNRRIDFTDDQHSVMVCTGRIVRTKGNCAKQDKEFTCLFAVAFSNFHFFFFGGRILVFFSSRTKRTTNNFPDRTSNENPKEIDGKIHETRKTTLTACAYSTNAQD